MVERFVNIFTKNENKFCLSGFLKTYLPFYYIIHD